MNNGDSNSIFGFLCTGLLFIIAKITLSDVATTVMILSGLTTVVANLPKIIQFFNKYLKTKKQENNGNA
jgi:hypothetical protein